MAITRRLEDPDGAVRLQALDDLGDYTASLDDCRQGVDAIEHLLRVEPDSFLVFRALMLLYVRLPRREPVLVDLLERPSKDIRREAAEHLSEGGLQPASAVRVAQALSRETDPWVRLALAGATPEAYEAEAQAALVELVRAEGPTSLLALYFLAGRLDRPEPLLEMLGLGEELRGHVINLLGPSASTSVVRSTLVGLMNGGLEQHRLFAARTLLRDDTAAAGEQWRAFVLNEDVSLAARAALVLQGGDDETWQPLACEATQANLVLAGEVERLLAAPDALREAMDRLAFFTPSRMREGWIRPPAGQESVRCARRPSGEPRPGESRLPAGILFRTFHSFSQDGVEWLADPQGACWVSVEQMAFEDPEMVHVAETLEADLPIEILQSIQTALATGDLEIFDPTPAFVGVRLRAASPDQRALWDHGEDGILEVLAAIEARALLRESEPRQPLTLLRTDRSPAPR